MDCVGLGGADVLNVIMARRPAGIRVRIIAVMSLALGNESLL